MEPEAPVQGAAKRKSWTRIRERPTELFREARSWLGYQTGRLPPLRAKPVKKWKPRKSLNPLKPSKPSKPPKPLASPPSSSPPGNNDADIQRRIGPIEPDILETDAAADAVAGDEDGRVSFNVMSQACSILALVVESQGLDLTGEEVQQAVVEAYLLCTTVPRDHGDGGGTGGISSPSNLAPAGSKSQGGNRGRGQSRGRGQGQGRGRGRGNKRGRSEDGGDEEEDEDGKRRKQHWLCPFYLHDPVRHRRCLRLTLSRINDVRTHIERNHLKRPHCPRCGLLFKDDPAGTALGAHVRECEELADFDYPGATPEQWLAIAASGVNRANGSRRFTFHNDEDEWFAIWDILFPLPGRARPEIPHALYTEAVQFTRDALGMFIEQGHLGAIADHTLPESSHPGYRAFLLGNMTYYYRIFIDYVEQLENLAPAGQSGPQPPIQMPTPPLPSLAARSYNTAGSNTGNPYVVPSQSLPLRGSFGPPAGPTFADAGHAAGPAPLQANPHTSVDADADPGGVDVIDEEYLSLPRTH